MTDPHHQGRHQQHASSARRVRKPAPRRRPPTDWDTTAPDYEFLPLRLPPDVTRISASMRLSIQAEFGGWELSRVRLYTDGSRRVLLRRKRPPQPAAPSAV